MNNSPQVDPRNASLVPRDGYEQTLRRIEQGGYCPFCEEHFLKSHQQPILITSDHWLVTPNNWPYEGSVHHLVFIARAHVEKMEDLSPEAWGDLHNVHRQIVETKGLTGGTLFLRSGDMTLTGATVSHLHAHLVVGGPRTEGSERISALVAFKK